MNKTIYLAGGCFWGVEAYMKQIKGILSTTCGYANGTLEDPSYEDVCTGMTGHAETVEVEYDSGILPLDTILKEFFGIIDPTSLNRQGGDTGNQYRTGIYFTEPADESEVKAFMSALSYDKPVVTEVLPLSCFYAAEEYHQDYLDKNPGGYCHVDLSKYGK